MTMYKHLRTAFFIIVILSVSLLVGCATSVNYKGEIFEFVNEHNEIILEDIFENDFTDSLALDSIESVDVSEYCVEFYFGGEGISASSNEYGFYYSFDGQPLGVFEGSVFCSSDIMTEDGYGYSTNFQNNYYYTEKICDNFWYYEFHL